MIDPHVEIILPLRFGHKMSLVVRKPAFCICENKDADLLRGNRNADQRLCFHYTDVQSFYFLNTKFQASSHLLRLYSPVCVIPGQKPLRPVFSERGSNDLYGHFPSGFMKSSCQPLETDKKVQKVLAHYLIEACL